MLVDVEDRRALLKLQKKLEDEVQTFDLTRQESQLLVRVLLQLSNASQAGSGGGAGGQ